MENYEGTMKTFGTLEYAIDKYSGSWTWKIVGVRAVMMVSKLIPKLWYGNGPNEVIIPDNEKNVKQIRLILERYPLEYYQNLFGNEKPVLKLLKNQLKQKLKNFRKLYPKNNFVGSC